MKSATAACLLVVVPIVFGCNRDEQAQALRKSLKQVEFARGSTVQYAMAPRGTQFIPGPQCGVTNSFLLQDDGCVVFIDEQPKYDWAHRLQLIFIPRTSGKPEILFRGIGFGDFTLKKPDGSAESDWKKY